MRFGARCVLLLACLALVAAGCGGDDDGTQSVTLADFSISLDSTELSAGEVTFEVTNEADQVHEFVVMETGLAQDQLPTDDEGDVDEEGSPDLSVVDEIEDIEAGTTRSLTVTLEPGSYVLICNLPGHYRQGMHEAITVS